MIRLIFIMLYASILEFLDKYLIYFKMFGMFVLLCLAFWKIFDIIEPMFK